MKLTFIQIAPFVAKWRSLRLTDDDLAALERLIMQRPEAGVLMQGTGGLRKIRFAPPSWNSGKSGAARVCYAVFAESEACILFTLFRKNVQPNLTSEQKQQMRRLLQSIRQTLGGE